MVANHWSNDGMVTMVFQWLHQPLIQMVFGPGTIALDGFSMVAYHWSRDGMVTMVFQWLHQPLIQMV